MQVHIIILFIALIICIKYYNNKQYKKDTYYQITKNPYSTVKHDKGKYIEYLTWKSLCHLENNGGKFLFNVYIPTKNNRTTEIDVLLIHPKGLFVFECKNFGGWIFGHEAHSKWTQTLPLGYRRSRKEYFYNPIMQNAAHIKHLKNLIGESKPMHSIIVFSDRCVLKNITVKCNNVSVINHNRVSPVLDQICNKINTEIYTAAEVSGIYDKLYAYTQMNHTAKIQHVKSVNGVASPHCPSLQET